MVEKKIKEIVVKERLVNGRSIRDLCDVLLDEGQVYEPNLGYLKKI